MYLGMVLADKKIQQGDLVMGEKELQMYTVLIQKEAGVIISTFAAASLLVTKIVLELILEEKWQYYMLFSDIFNFLTDFENEVG